MLDNGLGELERLTSGETLIIDRRRRGENQIEAARRLGVTSSMYGKMEREIVDRLRAEVFPLAPHERCLIYRRRAGKRQEDVAAEMEICRWWFNQMERGDVKCDPLLWYWEQ